VADERRVLRWEDPPLDPYAAVRSRGHESRRHPWALVAETLRSQPGRWALVHVGTRAELAWKIRHGMPAPFAPAGDFEAVGRHRGRECRVYARYLGDGEG
jgi:hypothetical protein